jgi:hypothetical protein
MSAITFDTLKYTKQLEQAGFSREQAEAQTTAYKQSILEIMSDFASKDDVNTLKKDSDTYKNDIASIKTDLAVLKWMVGFIMVAVALPFIKSLF